MKSIKMVISFILICVIAFSCFTAEAESCYVALRELMNSKDQEHWYLGKGKNSAMDASKVFL